MRLMKDVLRISLSFIICLSSFGNAVAQKQQHFKKHIPAGDYSGICPLGDDRYAVVSDKAETDGFFVFHIIVDEEEGRIVSMENEGYRSSGLPNRDMEGICYRPSTQTVFISGEADNEVYEYTLDGQRTGRRLQMPAFVGQARANRGLEALTYDAVRHLFYTTTEQPVAGESHLRILEFDDSLNLLQQYVYHPDDPISRKYFHGVSELCALSDGRLLVLERQVRIPRLKIGACTVTRIYEVRPGEQPELTKRLVTEFTTRLNIFSRKFANFEGLCQVSDRWLLLMADSQSQYKGVLRDWLKIIPMPPVD